MSNTVDARTLNEQANTGTEGKVAATIALVLFLSWVAIVALLHLVRPDLPPLQHYISNYALGPYGFLMVGAFLAWSAGLAFLVLALYQGLPLRPRSWVALVLLSICSLLMFLVAVFRTDPTDEIVSTSGLIHVLASFPFFLMSMTAMLVLSVRMKRARLLKSGYSALFWLSIAAPILFVLIIAVFRGAGLSGLGQRLFALTLISWLALLANGLRTGAFGGVQEAAG